MSERIGQKKHHSFLEVALNIGIGFTVSAVSNAVILPAMGFAVHLHQILEMTVYFTFISVARGYGVRRLFNHLHVKGIL